jgi:hypothetical protein
MAVSMVGPPKTDCPRVREKVIWESLYPILGSIRPHGLVLLLQDNNRIILEIIMNNTRKTLLVTAAAAALLAGAGSASAQGTKTTERRAQP